MQGLLLPLFAFPAGSGGSGSSVPAVRAGAQRFVLPVHLPDDQLPLCSFFMVMPGGAVFENNGSYGVSRILAAALTAGGGRYSEKQFLQKLDEAGVELEISAGANTLLLNFTAPKRKMNQAVAVIAEVLSAPRLPEDAVCREIIRCQEQIKERQFVPVKKAYDQALLAMYGEHPYAYGKCGKAEDIAMLNRGKLLDFYRSYCAGKRVMSCCRSYLILTRPEDSVALE